MGAKDRGDETYRGFVLRKGDDGLVMIIDATGKPLSEDVKFAKATTARAFLDQWVARNDQTKEPR